MQDPEGNEFCAVLAVSSENPASSRGTTFSR